MISLQRFRLPPRLFWLKLTFFSVLLALGKATFDPTIGHSRAYVFPDRVPLTGAQFLNGQSTIAKTPQQLGISLKLSGHKYEYQHNDRRLAIYTYYVTETDGDIANYFKSYQLDDKIVTSAASIQKQNQNGFYDLFVHEQTAYLSSCINSRGYSTVTREQFKSNRNVYDLQINRSIPILLGREKPRDARCLWVTLSLPIQNQSVQAAYAQLETAWSDWYTWWFPRFPQL